MRVAALGVQAVDVVTVGKEVKRVSEAPRQAVGFRLWEVIA